MVLEMKCVDLFSGCGGLGLGLHESGFHTVLANELHPDPASTYVHNLMPENPEDMLVGPIQNQLSRARLSKWKSGVKYDVGCLAGGPPWYPLLRRANCNLRNALPFTVHCTQEPSHLDPTSKSAGAHELHHQREKVNR